MDARPSDRAGPMTSPGFVSRLRKAVSAFRHRRHLARRFGPVERVPIETHGEGYGSWSMLRCSLAHGMEAAQTRCG